MKNKTAPRRPWNTTLRWKVQVWFMKRFPHLCERAETHWPFNGPPF